MTSVDSQPCSSCAIASAAITADRFWSDGYFATSRSNFRRASALSMRKREETCNRARLYESHACGSFGPVGRRAEPRGRNSRLEAALRLSQLVRPVVDVVARARQVPHTASKGTDFARVRVLADLGGQHRADRQVGEIAPGVIDDLVRRLRTAGRAADDVARAYLSGFAPVAEHPLALHDEEHFLFAAVAVERTRALARRHDVV